MLDFRPIRDDVAAAMRWAREHAQMDREQFARELNRLVPEHHVDARDVGAMEAGETEFMLAAHLVAAARIVGQPASVALGELDVYEVTIPALERRVERLEAMLEQAKG